MLSKRRIDRLLQAYRKKESDYKQGVHSSEMTICATILVGDNRFVHFIKRRKRLILNRNANHPDTDFLANPYRIR